MNITRPFALLIVAIAFTGPACAHNPDTSYARFKVTRDALESKFTYDLFTLLRLAPGLDANADRQVTAAELAALTPTVISYLRQHVRLEIDGQPADFGDAQAVTFPPDTEDAIQEKDYHEATSLIDFSFRRPLAKAPADVWVRFEFFPDLGEQHIVLGAIEHEGEEHEVLFRYYEPDYLYDTGYDSTPLPVLETSQAVPSSSPVPGPLHELTTENEKSSRRSNMNDSRWSQLAGFFRLGVEHIFLGYDHILFLLSLIVVCRFRDLVKIVTAFTVAHTITLILATLEHVQLPGRLVETAIAATIIYVAVENFWIKEDARRWMLTFAFGLIHGFGFAGVLRELGLPTFGLVRSLVAFNIGVEAGQLAIVLILFPLAAGVARWQHGKYVQWTVSGVIAACGLGWLVDRAFGFGFMPF
ncbi:MAG: HupE/UreJ family protein [Planctomycetia bacterium]|nr:HupE/UreJ family protein [Planctomycetia bacterium]